MKCNLKPGVICRYDPDCPAAQLASGGMTSRVGSARPASSRTRSARTRTSSSGQSFAVDWKKTETSKGVIKKSMK